MNTGTIVADKMSLKQLYIAAEYEKFSVSDLIERAKEIAKYGELQPFIEYVYSFEVEPRSGSWYTPKPTVK